MAGHVEMHTARMNAALSTDAGRWADRVGRRVTNKAKHFCPVDEGRLRASITYHVTLQPHRAVVRIGSPLEYARYRHEGTGLFGPKKKRIYPVSKQALKFRAGRMIGPLPVGAKHPAKGKRGFIFAKSVAGIPGSPFLTHALEAEFGPLVRRNPTK